MLDLALSLLMLAGIALLAGAVYLWRKGERQRPLLMLLLVAIMAVNVAIWTVPDKGGKTLAAPGATPAP
jgi:carbon starvation protein CstA